MNKRKNISLNHLDLNCPEKICNTTINFMNTKISYELNLLLDMSEGLKLGYIVYEMIDEINKK